MLSDYPEFKVATSKLVCHSPSPSLPILQNFIALH